MARTNGAIGSEKSLGGRPTGTGSMAGYYANGALGLAQLDGLRQTAKNTSGTTRKAMLHAQSRQTKTLLFQPRHPDAPKERRAALAFEPSTCYEVRAKLLLEFSPTAGTIIAGNRTN